MIGVHKDSNKHIREQQEPVERHQHPAIRNGLLHYPYSAPTLTTAVSAHLIVLTNPMDEISCEHAHQRGTTVMGVN